MYQEGLCVRLGKWERSKSRAYEMIEDWAVCDVSSPVPLPNLHQVKQVIPSLLTLMMTRELNLTVSGYLGWGASSLLLPVHGFHTV